MKTKLYLIGGVVIGLSLSLGTIAEAAFVPISVPAGGTGSTTAQTVGLGGILAGNGKAAIKSVVIGSNLTWDGTTLSATGGGSSFAYPFPGDATTTILTLTNGASIPKLTNLTSNGLVKTSGGNGTLSIGANGSDYTLITANTCGAGNHVSAITAAGAITCSADTGAGGTGLATSSPVSGSNLLTYSSAGAGSAYGTATTSFTPSAEFTIGGTLGALVGGANSTLTIATNGVALTKLAQIAANSVLGNITSATGNVTAFATSSLGIALGDTTGTLAVNRGGTNITSYTTGDITYASGAAALSKLAVGTGGQVLGVCAGVPCWVATSTGSGSGTVGAGTTGQFPYYAANSTTLTATSTLFILPNGNIGIGSTTPWANLSIQDFPGAPQSNPIFSVSSSTPGVNAFTVYPDGYIQAGPLASRDTAYCTYGKYCLGYFGSDNTLSGVNIEVGNYSAGTSAYSGFTVVNNLDDATGAHYVFFGQTGGNYNDPTFSPLQAFSHQGQVINSDGQWLIQANLNATTTVGGANNIIFTANGAAASNELGRWTVGATTSGLNVGTSTHIGTTFNVINSVGSTTLSAGTNDAVANTFTIASSTGQNYLRVTSAGYLVLAGTSTPALSSCGTSPSILNGGPLNFSIQVGSVSATGCTATFPNTPLPTAPVCNVTQRTGSITNTLSYTVSTSAVVVTETGLTGNILDVNCIIGNTS